MERVDNMTWELAVSLLLEAYFRQLIDESHEVWACGCQSCC